MKAFGIGFLLSVFGILRAQVVAPELIQTLEPQEDPNLKSYLVDPTRVQVTVDAEGNPIFLRSTVGLPDNFVRALAQWRFRPGTKDGKKAAFTVFVDAQVRRPLDRYLRSAVRKSDRPWEHTPYGQAKLTPEKAADFEAKLEDNDASVNGRGQLLHYSVSRTDAATLAMRERQISWLVQNRPGAEVLATPSALIFPAQGPLQDAAAFEMVKKLWLEQVAKEPKDAVILGHAAWFLELSEPATAERILAPVVSSVGGAAAWLGEVLGYGAMGIDYVDQKTGALKGGEQLPDTGFGAHARSALADTADERILLSALTGVVRAGGSFSAAGKIPPGYAEYCSGLLLRVKAFYPGTTLSCSTGAANAGISTKGGSTVTAAKLVRQDKPGYPPDAKSRGIEGTVSFAASIGIDGKVRNLELLNGPLALYSASRASLEKWEFDPTRVNGVPVEVSTSLDVHFTMRH